MNTTLNELVFELMELRRAFIKDTDPLDKRIVIDWLLSMRARLLEQKFKKPFASIDDNYVQYLGPIRMQKVLSNELSIPIQDFNYMYLTTIDIPKTIERPFGAGTFTRIGPADRLSKSFTITTFEKALASGNGKFNQNEIYAFPYGDRIGLYSKSGIHFTISDIDVNGVFQDAVTAARIHNPSWTYDDNFPINKELIDQMKDIIVKTKFGLTLVQAGDKVDNREDNPTVDVNAKTPNLNSSPNLSE